MMRARIAFYIKWPHLRGDEIAAGTGPKWIAVLARGTVLSLFWLIITYFLRVPFQTKMSLERGDCSCFGVKSRGFARSGFISSLATRSRWGCAALWCFGGAGKHSREEEFILRLQQLSGCELKLCASSGEFNANLLSPAARSSPRLAVP